MKRLQRTKFRRIAVLTTALLTMSLAARADVMINKANFPDANFRQWLKEQYYGMDGVLTDQEFRNVEEINVYNRNISSLKGIEYFTGLSSLRCQSNQLTTLDVSKNTALAMLLCSDNQLKALDVSLNTSLTALYCDNNQLTTLDVSQNTALKYLNCNGNLLTELDVTKNTEMINLQCNDNQLTTLDLSQNNALLILEIFDNQLAELDVRQNTALQSLRCNGNQLTAIDVSQNTALTQLYCRENQLTAIDVSQNSKLTQLRISGNRLTEIDVTNNSELTFLICDDNQLTTLDVSRNTKLKYLYCYANQIRGEAMDRIISDLGNQTSARLYVYLKDAEQYGHEPDGNVCTKANVEAARAKGWEVYCSEDDGSTWIPYDGAETDGVAGVGMDEADAPLYDLSGRRLGGQPVQKGIYLRNGRKTIFK